MNYYDLLDINESDSLEIINEKLNKLNRSWQRRTNAPNIEKRQEAEKMLMHIQEAKKVFNNGNAKPQFDNQSDDVPKDLLDIVDEMLAAADQGSYAEAMILAKQASLKYPNSFAPNYNYAFYLSNLDRFEEAVAQLKKVAKMQLDDGQFLTTYALLIQLIYLEIVDMNLARKYLDIAIKPAMELEIDDYSQQKIIFFETMYMKRMGDHEGVREMHYFFKRKFNDFKYHLDALFLDSLKVETEAHFDVGKNGDYIVTNLEQIKALETLLQEAKSCRDHAKHLGKYDVTWIDARTSYINRSKEKGKSKYSLVAKIVAIIIAFNLSGYIFNFSFYYLFRLSNLFYLIVMIVCIKYGFKSNKPIYELNRKDVA